MSYILEALRRADAERERGAVPDLRAQPLGPMADASEPARPRWPWIAGGAAALLLAALAWRLAAGPEAPAEAPAPAVPTPAPAPSPPPAPQAAAPLPPAAPTPAVTPRAPPPTTAAAPLTAAPAAPPGGSARPAPSVSVVAAPPPPRPASASVAAATPKPAASAPQGRVYTLAELPPEIRGQLPRLAIGGSMYSENAANRMLILNGQVFHENEQPAAEVTLEQIRLKSAVLRFRGYRYELSY